MSEAGDGSKRKIVLDVSDLEVKFFQDVGTVNAVNDVSLRVHEGQSVGIVGESGCGKSVTSYSVLRLLPNNARITNGTVLYTPADGNTIDLTQGDPDGDLIRGVRGKEIAMIFQEPMSALSPVHTIYDQMSEGLMLHTGATPEESRKRVIEMLRLVGISAPEQRVDEYIFQLSGGMRQRVMIAMALICNPRVLIADEPTTALDVTIQAQVLKLIKRMQSEFNLSLMLITHDLGVIAHVTEYVYVMYLGQIMEEGPVSEVLVAPKHPYTRDLLKSIPKIRDRNVALSAIRGSVPDAYSVPKGCPYASRCANMIPGVCTEARPARTQVGDDHFARCYLYTKETADAGADQASPGSSQTQGGTSDVRH